VVGPTLSEPRPVGPRIDVFAEFGVIPTSFSAIDLVK
jgi:hypothetical protein